MIETVHAWLGRSSLHAPGPAAPSRLQARQSDLDHASLTPRAVVDWDMGTRGDPLFDLATLLSYWPDADDPPNCGAA